MNNERELKTAQRIEEQAWNRLRNHVLMCPTCYKAKASPYRVSGFGCGEGKLKADQYKVASQAAGRFGIYFAGTRPTTLAGVR